MSSTGYSWPQGDSGLSGGVGMVGDQGPKGNQGPQGLQGNEVSLCYRYGCIIIIL